MTRWRSALAIAAAAGLIGPALHTRAHAGPKDDDVTSTDDEEDDDADARPAKPAKGKPAGKAKAPAPAKRAPASEDEEDGDDGEHEARSTRAIKSKPRGDDGGGAKAKDDDEGALQKQDLNGHDLGTTKKENVFERDRFFVDKVDSDKTADGTLIQGSLTSTSFAYRELGGTLIPPVMDGEPVPSNSEFTRLFTELRLQTDFRHIAGSRWEARVDVRGRAVMQPGASDALDEPVTKTTVQSGFRGDNELEIKELWLVRNGVRSDIFLGRQFIPDLGGLRIDGLRVDYAASRKFTYIGFGGLYPIRGSRSITTDYTALTADPGPDGNRAAAGKYTIAGGFGAAYRTPEAYGAFGGVVLAPLESEGPRIFGTSTGYWRYSTQLDLYHLAVVDVIGSNAVNAGLTNLSLGLNYKPDQRLRATLSLNRVDTETLNVQAQAFLSNPDPGANVVQNEAYLTRIASNEGRASLSAGLGSLQRFEITAAATYRYRGEITISTPPQTVPNAPNAGATLPAASSVEVYGAITDRRSISDLRLGIDGSKIFGVGSATYQRTESTSVRVSAAHDIKNGQGEWEAEAAYTMNKDDTAGMTCGDIATCYGSSNSTVISVGGNLYYRFNRDWFALGSLFINRLSITHLEIDTKVEDPTVTGVSAYFRVAYRF